MSNELARACPEAIVVSIMPDVCLTPGPNGTMVPVGYMIRARLELAIDTNPRHLVGGYPVFTMKSRIPTCEGNEAGTGGGVISGVNKGWCRPLEASSSQKSGGEWVVREGDLFAMNCNGPEGVPNTYGKLYIIMRVAVAPTTPISKFERTSVDPATGQIVIESVEVVRYPIVGELVETRQRTVFDPKTGEATSESVAITTHPDGSRSYVHNAGAFDPELHQFAWKTTTGDVDTAMPVGDEENEPIELDQPVTDDNAGGGFFLQDESEVFRPSVDPNEEISDNDPEVMNDPDVQAALAEEAAHKEEMGGINKELAWEAAKASVDGAGVVDPTPVCDLVGAAMALTDGDWGGAGLSVLGAVVPYAGDAIGKPIKAGRAGVRLAKIVAKAEAGAMHMAKLRNASRKALDEAKSAVAKRRAAANGGGGGGGLPDAPKPKNPGNGSFVAKAANKKYTVPSGKMGGKPRGKRTRIDGGGDKPRGHRRENEAADTLAGHGYDVEQNPGRSPNGRYPDYKIEGEYFECYAPKLDTGEKGIRNGIVEKVVDKKQAERIVLNLDDSSVTPSKMKDYLATNPVPGLKEVMTIKNGNIQHIFP